MSTPDRGRTSAVVPIYKSILGVAEIMLNRCRKILKEGRWDMTATVSYHDGLMMDAPESPPAVQ